MAHFAPEVKGFVPVWRLAHCPGRQYKCTTATICNSNLPNLLNFAVFFCAQNVLDAIIQIHTVFDGNEFKETRIKALGENNLEGFHCCLCEFTV
jgi:hypothetical protein